MVMTDKPTLISLGATFTCSRSPRTVRPLPSAAINDACVEDYSHAGGFTRNRPKALVKLSVSALPRTGYTEERRYENRWHSTLARKVFLTKATLQFRLLLPNHRPAVQ